MTALQKLKLLTKTKREERLKMAEEILVANKRQLNKLLNDKSLLSAVDWDDQYCVAFDRVKDGEYLVKVLEKSISI